MTTPTPVADRVLGDPMAIPPGVDEWLRRIERGARELLGALRAGPVDAAIPAYREAEAELSRFVDDRDAGALHRVVRRPLAQLARGTPAERSFTRFADALFERANVAIALQREATALRVTLDELRATLGARFPRSFARHLRDAHVGEEWIERARRVSDLRAMARRTERIRILLSELAARVPAGAPAGVRVGGDADAPTVEELLALDAAREGERGVAGASPIPTHELRVAAAAHLRGLARGQGRGASTPVHFLAEQLAEQSLLSGASRARRGEDTELWGALLQASERARFAAGAALWHPRVAAPPPPPEEPSSTTVFYVVPIDDEYLLLTQKRRSPVRVHSRALRVGETAECRTFAPEDAAYVPAEMALHAAPLFDGLRESPGWYRTHTRALVDVVAAHEGGFFARVRRRGRLAPLHDSPAAEHSDTAGALRVVAEPGAAPPDSFLAAQPLDAERPTFGGVTTLHVRVPMRGMGRVWLRTGGDGLDQERALFSRLREIDPRLAPEFLARGRTGAGETGWIYAPPLALRPQDSPSVAGTIQEDRPRAVWSLARLASAVLRAGFALRLYHPDAFAWSVEAQGHVLYPRAVLVHAAAAAPIGAPGPGTAGDDARSFVYPRLRFHGFPPPLTRPGELVWPEHEGFAFALGALEVLALTPLLPPNQWISWDALPAAVLAAPDGFAFPAVAQRLAGFLAAGDGAGILELIGKITALE